MDTILPNCVRVKLNNIQQDETHICWFCGEKIDHMSKKFDCQICKIKKCNHCNKCFCDGTKIEKEFLLYINYTYCRNTENLQKFKKVGIPEKFINLTKMIKNANITLKICSKNHRKQLHKNQSNKKKNISNIINTTITMLVGYIILGIPGILISFIPDFMLIFIISDLWEKNPRNKLTGIKLKIHQFMHSIFLFILILILTIVIFLPNTLLTIKIIIILIIHIILDYLTHDGKNNNYFKGYNILNK